MNKQEISTILTQSGVGGLEKEIKKQKTTDFLGVIIMFIAVGICCAVILHRDHKEKQSEIQQFKYDYATKVGKQYGMAMDSLVKISENNGIENCVIKTK